MSLEELPPEILSEIYSHLTPQATRNAVRAGMSDVFTHEWNNRRYKFTTKKISFEDAFYPTFGHSFADLLFTMIIPTIIASQIVKDD